MAPPKGATNDTKHHPYLKTENLTKSKTTSKAEIRRELKIRDQIAKSSSGKPSSPKSSNLKLTKNLPEIQKTPHLNEAEVVNVSTPVISKTTASQKRQRDTGSDSEAEPSGVATNDAKKVPLSHCTLTSKEAILETSTFAPIDPLAQSPIPAHTTSAKPNLKARLTPSLYPENYIGPFIVFIEPLDAQSTNGKLNPTSVGRLLSTTYTGSLSSVKSTGIKKVSVQLVNRTSANNLLNDTSITQANLKASIPFHLMNRQGVIKSVPLDVTEEDLLDFLFSHPRILDARRLDRRVEQDDGSFLSNPTGTIVITFEGQTLPPHIDIFSVRHRVEPYIAQVKMCFACFRYGHIAAQCNSRELCIDCGRRKHDPNNPEDTCSRSSIPLCVNCKQEHLPNDKNCPEYKYKFKVRAYAARNNISIQEAYSTFFKLSPPTHKARTNLGLRLNAPTQSPILSENMFPGLPHQTPNAHLSNCTPTPPHHPFLYAQSPPVTFVEITKLNSPSPDQTPFFQQNSFRPQPRPQLTTRQPTSGPSRARSLSCPPPMHNNNNNNTKRKKNNKNTNIASSPTPTAPPPSHLTLITVSRIPILPSLTPPLQPFRSPALNQHHVTSAFLRLRLQLTLAFRPPTPCQN